jgi:hypothetical protein
MFKHNSRIETILRIGLMLVLLLNACGPVQNKPQPAATKSADTLAGKPASLPTQRC